MKSDTNNLSGQPALLVMGYLIFCLLLPFSVLADVVPGERTEERSVTPMTNNYESQATDRGQEISDDATRASARFDDNHGSGGFMDYSTRFVDDDEWCQWKTRLSLGVPVWFFDEEDNQAGAGGYLDFWRTDIPLNFRVGIEGRHMDLHQESAEYAREWFDKTTQISFYRIPFSLEYMHGLTESMTLYFGGGPDIIRTANDISEGTVGMHLSSRLHYAFTQRWGMALEAGYMWGEIDGQDGDIVLDNAFVVPTLTYTF